MRLIKQSISSKEQEIGQTEKPAMPDTQKLALAHDAELLCRAGWLKPRKRAWEDAK